MSTLPITTRVPRGEHVSLFGKIDDTGVLVRDDQLARISVRPWGERCWAMPPIGECFVGEVVAYANDLWTVAEHEGDHVVLHRVLWSITAT